MADRKLGRLCLVHGRVSIIASVHPANAATASEAESLKRITREVDGLKGDK